MKQVKFLAVALVVVLVSTFSAHAQKIGYVDAEAILYSLPEIPNVQQALEKFQRDSIGREYEQILSEYNRKDSLVKNASTPKSVKDAAEKDLVELRSALGNWQNYAGQWNQRKSGELLAPLNKKVMDAVNAVAKEKGYTYILNPGALIVAPPGDDISMIVAQRLGIKVPAQGGAAPAAAPKK